MVLFYDHMATLPDECRFVWQAKPSFAKYAFLLNRYVVPSVMILVLCGKYKYGRGWSTSSAYEGLGLSDEQRPAVSDRNSRISSESPLMHHPNIRTFTIHVQVSVHPIRDRNDGRGLHRLRQCSGTAPSCGVMAGRRGVSGLNPSRLLKIEAFNVS